MVVLGLAKPGSRIDIQLTLKIDKTEIGKHGIVLDLRRVERAQFLSKLDIKPGPMESIEKSEGTELHRLLDRAIEEVNGELERANSAL